MKAIIMALAAVAGTASLFAGREDRLRDLGNICAYIPSDNLEVEEEIPTPDEVIVKYHVSTNDVVEDLKEIVRRSDISETNFYARVPRRMAVTWIGQYGTTNDLVYLSTIMTNSSDHAQESAVLAGLSILKHSPDIIPFVRDVVTNVVVYSSGLRGTTYIRLLDMCTSSYADMYINDSAQEARIASFFIERAAIERDDMLFIDRCAYTLNPAYRHSQLRRDNLAALRPPNLTGKRADLYDAAQTDAAQED